MPVRDTRSPDWETQSLRLTLFPSGSVGETGEIWRELTGQTPEVDENRPREGLRRQVGPFGNGMLEVTVSAPRLDVQLAAIVSLGSAHPVIGPFVDELGRFKEMVRPWLEASAPAAIRVAFGAVLLFPVSSREEAYNWLQSLVPSVQINAQHAREFMYRINRPASSRALNGIELNRITAWNAIISRTIMTASGSGAPLTALQVTEQNYVRLEVDNSTPADNATPYARPQLWAILNELIEMAEANARAGEQP